jgi:SMC interacting uncharacterized protein involved in chromosome segregation
MATTLTIELSALIFLITIVFGAGGVYSIILYNNKKLLSISDDIKENIGGVKDDIHGVKNDIKDVKEDVKKLNQIINEMNVFSGRIDQRVLFLERHLDMKNNTNNKRFNNGYGNDDSA